MIDPVTIWSPTMVSSLLTLPDNTKDPVMTAAPTYGNVGVATLAVVKILFVAVSKTNTLLAFVVDVKFNNCTFDDVIIDADTILGAIVAPTILAVT
jgi:hypothetical protein